MSKFKTVFGRKNQPKFKFIGSKINNFLPCPPIIERAMQEILERGLEVVGIFRISSSQELTQEAIRSIQKGENLVLKSLDIHTVSALLKSFIRELSDPLLTFTLFEKFLLVSELPDEQKYPSLLEILEQLPFANLIFLFKLTKVLEKISEKSEINKMGMRNLALIFGPSILKEQLPKEALDQPIDPQKAMQTNEKIVCVASFIFENYQKFQKDILQHKKKDWIAKHKSHQDVEKVQNFTNLEDIFYLELRESEPEIDSLIFKMKALEEQIVKEKAEFKQNIQEKKKELEEKKATISDYVIQVKQKTDHQKTQQDTLMIQRKNLIEKHSEINELNEKKKKLEKQKKKLQNLNHNLQATLDQEKEMFEKFKQETEFEKQDLVFHLSWFDFKISELEKSRNELSLLCQKTFSEEEERTKEIVKTKEMIEKTKNQIIQTQKLIESQNKNLEEHEIQFLQIIEVFDQEKQKFDKEIQIQEQKIQDLSKEIENQKAILKSKFGVSNIESLSLEKSRKLYSHLKNQTKEAKKIIFQQKKQLAFYIKKYESEK
ncbi:rho gtpase-activating protein 68f [Anaeramoeba ignava]|uniref:Rho gtpase-activating protein 68f n=1 Tax=Anaeramoeba ignava TaxID=1746090 RepID=A0A9Q0LZL9_ANAIG|nr:rho gtpase-activating protein 68f [Anaeramoeba ignava]